MPTLSFDVGSHHGVPCRGVLLGRVERKGGKTSPKKAREHLEGGNQFSPNLSLLQPVVVGEVTNTSYQP